MIQLAGPAPAFSPNGDGRQDVAQLALKFGVADDATVDVIDADAQPVRRLASEVPVAPGRLLRLRWNGRTDAGTRAPDGRYRLRVALRRRGLSVVVGGRILLDTRPPRPRVRAIKPSNVIGAGPVQIVMRRVSPRFPTQLAILRTDQGAPHQVAAFSAPPGARQATWDGKVGGLPAPPGVYLVRLSVRDRAGNVGTVPRAIEPGAVPGAPGITVRGIAAQPPLRPVTAGTRAELFVDARHRPYRWVLRRVGARHAAARGRAAADQARLSVRVPRGPSGAYLLWLHAGRYSTTVPILVQSTRRSRVLVVVPAISWLGSDPVDDPPFDGVPNTLADGGPVQWPRVMSGPPAGFRQQVAPLLAFLDRHHVSYDLTSDLDLALSGNPRATDRPGVLLAGSEVWVPRELAQRLRRYVTDGGRVAELGTNSLRRTVTLRTGPGGNGGELVRPTQPGAEDAFGARLSARTTDGPATLTAIDGNPNYGLLTGIVSLPGFSSFEESAPPQPPARLLVGVGQQVSGRPAITAVQLGKGLVVRVGVTAWASGLRHPAVAQVTLNVFDLLRGATPRIRTTSP
ncbi:MAG TPA: N,N-dimethylformamidase beta subunit family domain-containing protein [Solirubrobacteraceae bacterium]